MISSGFIFKRDKMKLFYFLRKNLRYFSQSAQTGMEENILSKEYPLSGIRVLDLSRIIAGPYCTMILADMGADVIKVEKPGDGDEARKWGPPFLNNSKDSVYFTAVNRNKRSVGIDLKLGRDIIYDLSKKCDVFVENYIPGKLDDLEMGYDDIRKVSPHIIYCSITGYGSRGLYQNKPGYDAIAASMGGQIHITGEQNGPPVKVGVAMTDIATGLYAHGAILAALIQRAKTGQGQKIDANLFSTQVSTLINVGANYLNAGIEAKRWGTAHESIVPYQSFKTKSGYFTVGAGSDDQFKSLCTILDIAEVLNDPLYKNNSERVKNRKELIKLLSDIFINETNEYWIAKFDKAPFPVAPVNSIAETFNDPHIKDIGLVKTLKHPVAGDIKVVGPPVEYSFGKNTARTAPPTLGQHTREVLKDVLGYDDTYITHLANKKVIQ